MATLLQKFVGADQWDAEDTVGRLGLLMHAAFLAVGFQPYGAQPATGHLLTTSAGGEAGPRRLSRYYTVPELARRGEGSDAAVLLLCARGGGGDVALMAFLTMERHLRRAYREFLDAAAAAPLLSRALRDAEPWASRVCWRLAGGVCWGLRAELCRRNGLPLTGLMSLPDDVKAEVLKRLDDGEDLARAECTCAQLRRLVAERDGELWRPLYEAASLRRRRTRRWLFLSFFSDSSSSDDDDDSESEPQEAVSWKVKYVQARPPPSWSTYWRRRWSSYFFPPLIDSPRLLYGLQDPPEEEEEEETSSKRGGEGIGGVHRRKVARNEFKRKRHISGAIHSPSSRYRWKHR